MSCRRLLAVVALCGLPGWVRGQPFHTDVLSYTGRASSPFDLTSGRFVVEDFEDGVADAPGITIAGGHVVGPGGHTASVDEDDGAIDGLGGNGHAYVSDSGFVAVFFDPEVLGGYPAAVGVVRTDGGGEGVFFVVNEGFEFGSAEFGEGSSHDTDAVCSTDHHRFVGWFDPRGIITFEVKAKTGRLAIDHLQFALPSPAALPMSTTTTTLPARTCGDTPDLLFARIETACPCAAQASRGTYVRCVRRTLRQAARAGRLSRDCIAAGLACTRRSACGRPRAVACCRGGECRITRSAAACKATGGVAGARPSCCAACATTGCFPAGEPPDTTTSCAAAKLRAIGARAACRAEERAKVVSGAAGDFGRCETTWADAVAVADARARAAGVGCRFVADGDRSVLDVAAGLRWEVKTTFTAAETHTWTQAMADVVGGAVGGSADAVRVDGCLMEDCSWRVPTMEELRATVDIWAVGCRVGGACIDPAFGPTLPAFYWTSTRYAPLPDRAWAVRFAEGLFDTPLLGDPVLVRLVQGSLADWPVTSPASGGGACPAAKIRALGLYRQCRAEQRARRLLGEATDDAGCDVELARARAAVDAGGGAACRFLDNGDDTVSDLDTGLMWERKSEVAVVEQWPWQEAMAGFVADTNGRGVYPFNGPSVAGYHDWRLPTVVELASILDRDAPGCANGGTCLDPVFGAAGTQLPYWSSTTRAGDSTRAWSVGFGGPSPGPVDQPKSAPGLVRAVRGG